MVTAGVDTPATFQSSPTLLSSEAMQKREEDNKRRPRLYWVKECLRLPRLCCPGLPLFIHDFCTEKYPKPPLRRHWRTSQMVSWLFRASILTALGAFLGLMFQLWYSSVYFDSREQVGAFRFICVRKRAHAVFAQCTGLLCRWRAVRSISSRHRTSIQKRRSELTFSLSFLFSGTSRIACQSANMRG